MTTPLTLNVISPKQLGQMRWNGIRGGATKTYSGIDLDIAKSALQKYIRRNMPEKAILTAIELYRLGEVSGEAGVTNLYNRLAIIANEDIGPANLPLCLEVTRIVESKDRDVARLVAMVQLLAQSPKTRIMSHAWRAYATSEGREITKRVLPLDIDFTATDLEYIKQNENSDIFLPSDPQHIRPFILIFLKRLSEKNFNAFTWVSFFLEISKEVILKKRQKFIGPTRGITGKSDILLWRALSKFLSSEAHDILVEAYYNHAENRPFLQNAIIIALYRVPYQRLDIEPDVNTWRQQPSLAQMLNGNFKLEIDAFAIDKHTQQGRAMGKGIREFLEEGMIVSPQDLRFFHQTLAEIYAQR